MTLPRILGKVDLFEEHEAEDAKEVVLEYGCCDEEFPTSLETIESHETVGDFLQSQPYVDAPLPSTAVNRVKRIVDFQNSVSDSLPPDKGNDLTSIL